MQERLISKSSFKMVRAKEIIEYLDSLYPDTLKAKWDFTDGYLSGNLDKEIKRLVITLEFRDNIKDYDMLIFHHPPLFGSEKKITTPYYDLLDKNAVIYSLHSRIDKSGDINKGVANYLFGEESFTIKSILDDGTFIFELSDSYSHNEIVNLIKKKFNIPFLKTIVKKDGVKLVAIHGGEGFNQHHVQLALEKNIDLYLAGDLGHHLAEFATKYDANFIDIEHFTEQFGILFVKSLLEAKFGDLEITFVEQKPYWTYE